MIEAKLENIKEITTRLNYADFYATRGAAEGVNKELEEIQKLAFQNLYPLKGVSAARPGLDINSNWKFKSAQAISNYPIMGVLYNTSPHAGYHEVGTGAYAAQNYFGKNYYMGNNFILPKNSRFLRFIYNGPPKKEKSPDPQGKAGTGEFIFAKYVEGQEPKRYLGNAVLTQQPFILTRIGTGIMTHLTNLESL